MKFAVTILSAVSICLTSAAQAAEYTQSMKCETTKGPTVAYQPNGGTFKVESVTDGDADPVFMVLGVWAPHSAHKTYASNGSKTLGDAVLLTEPNAVFLKQPTYVKVDGEYFVTSAKFKVTSKMRKDFRPEIKNAVKDTSIGDLSLEKLKEIKQSIDSTLEKALAEQTVDSEVVCEMTGSLK